MKPLKVERTSLLLRGKINFFHFYKNSKRIPENFLISEKPAYQKPT